MRSYLIPVITLFALLSIPVIAEDATITVSHSEEDERTVGVVLYLPAYWTSSTPVAFDRNIFVQTIEVSNELPRCSAWFYSGYTNCGSINLCVRFGTEPAICKPVPNEATPTVTFDVDQFATEVTLSITGARRDNWAAPQITINTVKVIGGDYKQVTRNLVSLRGDAPVNLKRVREVLDVTGLAGEVFVSSDNSKVMAWFDRDGTGISPTTTTTTAEINDYVVACLDIDSNLKCDYSDEAECSTVDKDWFDGYCCGDAPYAQSDCQWYDDKKAVCGKNVDNIWTWAAVADVGLINFLSGSCPNVQLVSDGTKFYTCGTIPTLIPPNETDTVQITGKLNIEGHDYLCDNEDIIECGGNASYSPNATDTGGFVTYNNQRHYCSDTGKWEVSLDGTNEASCNAAGFGWTGTKCCGEVDDQLDTFEDPGQNAGCFDNDFIESGEFLAAETIINHQGEFYICDPSLAEGEITAGADPIFANTGITPTARGACGTPLQDTISVGSLTNILCMPSGEWLFTSSTGNHTTKSTAWQPPQTEEREGCCPDDQCWDGAGCKDIGDYYITEGQAFRCDDVASADWVATSIRHDRYRRSTGFCQNATQCLVSNAFSETWDNFPDRYWTEASNSEKPKCIADGQYISDHYCERGQWSSRTKLVATQLLATALSTSPTNFSLYCDSYDKVLNKYAYSTDYGSVTTFLREFCYPRDGVRLENCVNNICVLRHGNNVAFGMAINTEIDGLKSPLQALNLSQDECDAAKNADGDYDACGWGVWYNHDTESLLYVPRLSPLPAAEPIVQDFFITPFNKLKDYVFTVVHKPEITQYNYTFFNFTPQFNQVYMAKEGFDFVYGFRESNVTLFQLDYGGIYFSNIDLPSDTCSRIIKRYDDRANCEEQPSPSEFYMAAHKTPPVNRFDERKSIIDVWDEMTGKLRVSP